jgi:hypothetical protein
METIQFSAIVDQEQVIRPPNGVKLPQGEIEVTVRQLPPAAPPLEDVGLAATRNWLLALAEESEKARPDLPTDLAARRPAR